MKKITVKSLANRFDIEHIAEKAAIPEDFIGDTIKIPVLYDNKIFELRLTVMPFVDDDPDGNGEFYKFDFDSGINTFGDEYIYNSRNNTVPIDGYAMNKVLTGRADELKEYTLILDDRNYTTVAYYDNEIGTKQYWNVKIRNFY